MGLTEGHWFENEEELTERQLEKAISDEKAAYERGFRDGSSKNVDTIPVGWLCKKMREEENNGNILKAEYLKELIWEFHQDDK